MKDLECINVGQKEVHSRANQVNQGLDASLCRMHGFGERVEFDLQLLDGKIEH